MIGKILAGFIVVFSLLFGAAVYYMQVFHYYEAVTVNGTSDVALLSLTSNEPEPILYENFQAIDAQSSPIRYRACFETSMSIAMLTETYEIYEKQNPVPRNAPYWFDCFDSKAIGAEIENGTALVFTSQHNLYFGIDRVVAITDDGRGYVWHEINDCGDKAYDGTPLGENCPEREGN